jgi:YD repeat-containing protein
MKISIFIFASLVFISCNKSDEPTPIKLVRTETTEYNGDKLYTTYDYDGQSKIISIRTARNTKPMALSASINYNGNEVVIQNWPDFYPNDSVIVNTRLTLGSDGKLLKRVSFMHTFNKSGTHYKSDVHDTLNYLYDAVGLLKETRRAMFVYSWSDTANTYSAWINRNCTFTNISGNLVNSDEHISFTNLSRNNSINTAGGGSSDYHKTFNYSKAYPNKTDVKNAAVLNVFYDDTYEPFLDAGYQNLPDQVMGRNVDKDLSGTIIFSGNYIMDVTRRYNADGLLSEVNFLNPSQYRKILYFYDR